MPNAVWKNRVTASEFATHYPSKEVPTWPKNQPTRNRRNQSHSHNSWITAIGNRLFPAETDASEGEYQVDVRLNTNLKYRQHDLPVQVQEKLLEFMRALGLEYGAIDMRRTPDGEYVFFEVNPAGQFLYVETATGMKISEALADHLAAGIPASKECREAVAP
jgi:hypothetical protein